MSAATASGGGRSPGTTRRSLPERSWFRTGVFVALAVLLVTGALYAIGAGSVHLSRRVRVSSRASVRGEASPSR